MHKEDLLSIVDHVIDGIITINNRGIMQYANPATTKLFGYANNEMIGQNVSMLMPEPDSSRHDTYLERYLDTGQAHIIGIGREVMGRRKDGSVFPFRLSISEVEIEGEIFFTGVVHDITEVKEAEKNLKSLNERLEHEIADRTEDLRQTVDALEESKRQLEIALTKEKELGKMKSDFVTIASHEFRTPLSSILTSCNLLEKYMEPGPRQDRIEKHFNRIKSSVRNLTSILQDFLSAEKLEAGQLRLQPVSFSLVELLKDVAEDMHSLLKSGQQIEWNGETNIELIQDKTLLHNVLVNLISNAIKYSPDSSLITLSVKTIGNNASLAVRDRGLGIPAHAQKHLFERFFRADNVRNIGGTGLGLHIVREYLHLMGGSIHYESKVEAGSVFTIDLPRIHR